MLIEDKNENKVSDENETEAVEVEIEETEKSSASESTDSTESATSEDDDELESFSGKVRTRINKLTARMREAERREEAAINYARSVMQDAENLKKRSFQIDESYLSEYKQRVESQEEAARREMQDAILEADAEKQSRAHQKLAQIAADQNEYVRISQAYEENKAAQQETQQNVQHETRQNVSQPVQQNYQQPMVQQTQVDPKAQKWAEQNTWFGEDEPMTLTAMSIHNQLVRENFDPESDHYYSELNERMREAWPHRFSENNNNNNNRAPKKPPVAGARAASRSSSKKKMTLSASEVAIADRLGVSYEAYAQQKARLTS